MIYDVCNQQQNVNKTLFSKLLTGYFGTRLVHVTSFFPANKNFTLFATRKEFRNQISSKVLLDSLVSSMSTFVNAKNI